MMLRCQYCGHKAAFDEMRIVKSGGFACADVGACDDRDADAERRELAELRRRKREGDELTEAELGRLSGAS